MPKKIVFLGYIDPGTGGLVLQWLIGVAVGSLFFFRRSIRRIMAFLRSFLKTNQPAGEQSSDTAPPTQECSRDIPTAPSSTSVPHSSDTPFEDK